MNQSARAVVFFLALTVLSCAALGKRWQQPPPPSPPPPPPAQEPAPQPAPSKQKYSHKNDFVIRGTVFDHRALSLPAAELRIRRSSEKKFRWETYTNSRGEFAVRVPGGSAYELVVRAKGFIEQARSIDATAGPGEQSLVFRMELASKNGKKEGK